MMTWLFGAIECHRAGGDRHSGRSSLSQDRQDTGQPVGETLPEGKLWDSWISKDIYAKGIFDTAEELAMGKEVTQEKYFWCPQHIIANWHHFLQACVRRHMHLYIY